MPVFGGYETVGQLSPTPFGSVYKAKKAGGASAEFIIKTFSPLGVDARELKRHPDVKRFLGSAELQKQVAARSQRWAPIHEMGISQEGAFYVSTLYPTSASRLIKGKAKLTGDDFYELSAAVLAGLMELRQGFRRSHGNLTASTILLPRMDASGYGQAMLAEPLSADSTKSASEQGDLAALGRVLYELVMYKPYNVTGAWPIPEAPDWARLGKRAKEWRAFCNKLLSTDPADAMTLEAAAAELEKLKPKKAPVPMWAIAAAVVVLLIGGGIIAYIKTRPDPHFQQKWTSYTEAYNGWFRIFANSEWQRILASDYPNLIAKAKDNPRLALNELSPPSGNDAPATREGQLMTARAIDVAATIQVDLLHIIDPKASTPGELDKSAVPDRLRERLVGLAATYSQRQWSGPAEALNGQVDEFKRVNPSDPGYVTRLGGLLTSLAKANKIEAEWKPIEDRAKAIAIAAGGDEVLSQLPGMFQRKSGAKASSIDELAENVHRFGTELNDADWTSFFTFVEKDWPDVMRDSKTLIDFKSGNNLYKRLPTEKVEWEKLHFLSWMKAASDYTSLPDKTKPTNDPRLAEGIDHLKDELGKLAVQANKAGPSEVNRVRKLEESVKGAGDQLKTLNAMRWSKGNQTELTNGVTVLQQKLEELALAVSLVRDDFARRWALDAQGLLAEIDRMRFNNNALDSKWTELKLNVWRINDANIRKGLENDEKRQDLKDRSSAAARALHDIDSSMPDRLDLTNFTRGRGWGPALNSAIQRLDEERRRNSMQSEIVRINFDRLSPTGPAVKPEHKEYLEWREAAASFISDVAELEDRLDSGYGLILAGGEKSSRAEDLLSTISTSPLWQDDVRIALKPLRDRMIEVRKLQNEKELGRLASLLEREKDPAMVVDAWRRLGQLSDWPRAAQDLKAEGAALSHIREMINLREKHSDRAVAFAAQRVKEFEEEYKAQAMLRWRNFAGAKRSQSELDQGVLTLALSTAKEFGVPNWQALQPPLPADVRWNIFVMLSKALMPDPAKKLEDKEAQTRVKQIMALLPTGNDAGPSVSELSTKLKKLADATGDGAGVEIEAGPGSKESNVGQWEKTEEGALLTFTWKGKGHQLSFIRCNGAKLADGSNAPPYYLSTTEVTLALFAEIMDGVGPKGTADALGLPLSGDQRRGIKGPQLWKRNDHGGIEPGTTWLRSHPPFEDYPPSLPNGYDKDRQPAAGKESRLREQMPMQYVPPAAALFIAAQIGCRFPTYSEWKVAATAQGIKPPDWPNLRDVTWANEFAHIMGLRPAVGPQAQAPDSGSIKTTAILVNTDTKAKVWNAQTLGEAGLGAIPAGFDDHYLWMRPVGNGKSFSDLYGNVAELVFEDAEGFGKLSDKSLAGIGQFLDQRAAQLFVVGGSFQSAPELGVDRQQLSDMNSGYADMGFRLAFVAAPAAIVDQLRDVMKNVHYVTAASPTTAPAN